LFAENVNLLKANNLYAISLDTLIVSPNQTVGDKTFAFSRIWPFTLLAVYLSGVVYCLFRIVIQLISIYFVLRNAKKTILFGCPVLVSKKIETPFSFFGKIVLNDKNYTESELNEILMHEETHVRQIHSLDVLLAELLCTFAWFNPFAWFLKKEIRLNLEYLADHSVLASGYEAEHYQFNLLQLSYLKNQINIINHFNVSQLKNRIIMMNKKQTSRKGMWKYALLIPATVLLAGFQHVLKAQNPAEQVLPNTLPLTGQVKSITTVAASDTIFSHVESMPQFPGGEVAMMKWLAENIKYPSLAQAQCIQGRVVVRFVVAPDGSIQDVENMRSLDSLLDAEAMRVVQSMPKWTPGKQDGKPVYVYYTLPILFKLQADDQAKTEQSQEAASRPLKLSQNPLLIVDGKEVPYETLNDIKSGNIESIDVLKNESATQVYGAKGINGVIVITTKKNAI
jgi:TonB family protein